MALPTVSSTFLDRIVAWVAPEAGMKRLRARAGLQMMSGGGYRGGKRGRRATQDWQHGAGSADADLLPDLIDLRGRSRDLARNNSLATGAVSTKMTNVVGSGLVPRSAIDRQALGLTEEAATEWESAAQREFDLAARSMDWTGVQNFYELQALFYRGVLESGDMLVIQRYRRDPGDVYGLKLQAIEADRLSNPGWGMDKDLDGGGQLAGGVQTNIDGVPVAYHVSDRHPGGLRQKGMTWRTVPARYSDGRRICLHLYDRLREGQTRGVPFLAPVIEDLKELGTYTENEARAAAVASLYTVFITTPEAGDGNGAPGAAGGKPVEGSDSDIKLGSGAIVALAPGEEVNIPTAGRPNPAFDAFVTAFCRQIGVALNLPYELLIKHFTASYTASRAALEIAWQTFRVDRTWFTRRCLDPVWELVIEEAVLTGRLKAPGFLNDPVRRAAWLGVNWIGATRISLDPRKEADADKTDMETGAKTLEQVVIERTGGDWDQKTTQRAKEVRKRRELGLETDPATVAAQVPGAKAAAAQPEPDEDDPKNEDA